MAESILSEPTACEEFEADLVLLHYNDLAGDERMKLQTHLSDCAACAKYLNGLSKLLLMTQANDDPPERFWQDYSRELRHKLEATDQPPGWWAGIANFLQPRLMPSLAGVAILVLTIGFTIGNGLWSNRKEITIDEALIKALPVAENLEMLRNMDILDNIELLEFMNAQSNSAV